MSNEYRIPDLGGATDVEVIEVSVAVGDQVDAEQTLLVLETDKASMEIPAEVAGQVEALKIAVGDKVNEGDVFITITSDAAGQPAEAAAVKPEADIKNETGTTEEPVTASAESTADAAAESTEKAIAVPDLGGSEGVEVIELNAAVGDQIDAEQTILVLESDKATMEIPAGEAGKILSLAVAVGDKVSQGDAMLTLLVQASASPASKSQTSISQTSAPAALQAAKPQTPAASTSLSVKSAAQSTTEPQKASGQVHAGPAVRKLAREFGVDLSQVSASGRKGRITKDDVQLFVKQRLNAPQSAAGTGIPAVPEVDFAKFGAIATEPLNNIKRATAKAMTTAWLNVPQVTQFDLADITDLESYRKAQNQQYQAQGIRFSVVPFVMKALAKVLREFPQFAASLSSDGESLIMKDYVHIGVAVDTPKGLLVPVIRDVDRLSVTEITQQLNEKAQNARDGKLTLLDMQGGCFSLSSLGGIGGTAFTPIVNPPEVAILGLSKSEMKPVWNGQEFVPRLMLPLSLSYDHRVIDGAEAARFSQRLVACLQDLRNVLM
ncbi:dihydrolipoyllysine-residue acetyltransferase [Bacterioplanoides sp.]|uniref:dihydrolipoyllysine-residue acetyltransferase n=1 Tax=Bacterioplanoides sp. TaxID=2066072 RepID=UPI003B5C92FB